MKIDTTKDTELTQVVDLHRRAFLARAPEFYSPVEVETLLGNYDTEQLRAMIADARLFCCRRNGDICGTSGWDKDRLRHLYVEPTCFGEGIGSALLEQTVTDFQLRTQKQTISAGVILYARGFYEKCGFQVVSKEKVWDESDYYLMRRDLGQNPPR